MDIKNIVTESPATISVTSAQDFLDPAFLPAEPFASTEEIPQESGDDARLQAKTPARVNIKPAT